MYRSGSRGVKRELVTPTMEMTPTSTTLMMMMMMMVLMEAMRAKVVMRMMTVVPLFLLKVGQWSCIMIYMVMTNTTRSLLLLCAVSTPGLQCSTGWSIGPILATQDPMRVRCTFMKEVGCASSTVPSQPGSHVQPPLKVLLGR